MAWEIWLKKQPRTIFCVKNLFKRRLWSIDQHLLRFRAPILWINPWLCTVRVNPCTVRDYTSLHTSIVKISLLSSLYHIAGKQPGNLNVSFYVIQHLLPQCPQTDSVGGNDANYAKAGVNPYEWQTWSYTTSIPHFEYTTFGRLYQSM